ncbi:MAG TPA: 5-(carboxyamino)imidazole ribonucleotide mutase [Pirellulaceae bacterium]|nr:5-(carboxyamino)imidazole ribonucleotide mutase [Pirellulaceae bacterium]HMO93398.1 5-(carboxyamino)imidazole ribonucleotide mutase [Pirellulaceae bacterium]HMP70478.1 5-(carboxyamino)imidazole ribonucleotide mutase [Pirellulaceae bacterium]
MGKVAILMGSENDWDYVKGAAKVFQDFGVEYAAHVLSAHRTPHHVAEFATKAKENGFQVIIAAAGGAAHLAGVVAAHTILPVIGLPVPIEPLGGLDSLLSMVQMPGDVPVATVAVGKGGPKNAGLLAVQMMALADAKLAEKYSKFKQDLVQKLIEKDAKFQNRLKD